MKYSFLILILVGFAFSASATVTSEWATAPHIKARLVQNNKLIRVEMEIEEGWHTYYKISGQAGIPTTFDWAGSKDFKVKKVIFPEYELHDEAGLKTYGYSRAVTFPVDAEIGTKPVVNLIIEGAVCNDICIPYGLKINQELEPVK